MMAACAAAAAMVACFGACQAQSNDGPGQVAKGRMVNGVPSDALGRCNDGTYVSTGRKATACGGHGGMRIWYLDGPERPTAADYAEPAPGRTAVKGRVGGVPSDALGLCQDGTYVSTGSKQTACGAHGGMRTWYLDGTPNG
jgi:hypothetical protein